MNLHEDTSAVDTDNSCIFSILYSAAEYLLVRLLTGHNSGQNNADADISRKRRMLSVIVKTNKNMH